MGFFKKIFGDKGGSKKLSIDALLASDDLDDSIIQLGSYINELCAHGDKLENLSGPQQIFYFNQNLEMEINNGGFNQYFFNSYGDFAHETVLSLKAINANKMAGILQLAINQFPGA